MIMLSVNGKQVPVLTEKDPAGSGTESTWSNLTWIGGMIDKAGNGTYSGWVPQFLGTTTVGGGLVWASGPWQATHTAALVSPAAGSPPALAPPEMKAEVLQEFRSKRLGCESPNSRATSNVSSRSAL